jgi:hypothetical protein
MASRTTRGLDAEPARDLGEAEAVHAFLGHHGLGEVEDLLEGLLAAPGSPVLGHDQILTRDPLDSLGYGY